MGLITRLLVVMLLAIGLWKGCVEGGKGKKRNKLQALIDEITDCDKECGGVMPPLLKLRQTSHPRAICNDGSRASYYYHDARSKQWVVFVQPGWLCYDPITCFVRNNMNKMLTTSWLIPNNKTGHGVLRTDPTNRLFWKYNMVDINYCSSDLFLGNTSGRSEVGVYFRGKEILFSVLQDLISYHRMQPHHTIHFVGSSAGGIGILVNMQEILQFLHDWGFGNMQTRVILDDAWFTEEFANDFPCFEESPPMPCITNDTLTQAFQVWNVNVQSACGESYEKNASWNCIFGTNALRGLNNVPLFVIQNQYDNYQLIMSKLLPFPSTETSDGILKRMDAILEIGKKVRTEISSLDPDTSGFFSMGCLNHHTLKGDYVNFPVQVQSQTLTATLNCWLQNEHAVRSVDQVLNGNMNNPGLDAGRGGKSSQGGSCSFRVGDECKYPQCNPNCMSLSGSVAMIEDERITVWTPEAFLNFSPKVATELGIFSTDRPNMERLSLLARKQHSTD